MFDDTSIPGVIHRSSLQRSIKPPISSFLSFSSSPLQQQIISYLCQYTLPYKYHQATHLLQGNVQDVRRWVPILELARRGTSEPTLAPSPPREKRPFLPHERESLRSLYDRHDRQWYTGGNPNFGTLISALNDAHGYHTDALRFQPHEVAERSIVTEKLPKTPSVPRGRNVRFPHRRPKLQPV